MLKDENIRPGSMIADNQVGVFGVQVFEALNIPYCFLGDSQDKAVARNPYICNQDEEIRDLPPYPGMRN